MIVKELFAKQNEDELVNYVFEHPDNRYRLFNDEEPSSKNQIQIFLRRMVRADPIMQADKVIIVMRDSDERDKNECRLLLEYFLKIEIARIFKEDKDMEAAAEIDIMPMEQVKKLARRHGVNGILYDYLPPRQELGFDVADTSIEKFGALTVAGLIMNDMMYNEYRSKLRWWWENPNRAEIFDGSPIHEGDFRFIDNDDLGDAYYRRALKCAYENYVEIKQYVKECLVRNDSEQGAIEQDTIQPDDDVSTMSIKIIRYSDLWQQTCIKLLVKLQSWLVRLDTENIQILTERYVSEYLKLVLDDIAENDGAAFLAIHNGKVIGFIAGSIEAKDEIDQLTTRCPKRGVIKELIINAEYRGQGIGQKLTKEMERFFENEGCEFVAVDVFAPNKLAIAFYRQNGYAPRNIEMYKRIKEASSSNL